MRTDACMNTLCRVSSQSDESERYCAWRAQAVTQHVAFLKLGNNASYSRCCRSNRERSWYKVTHATRMRNIQQRLCKSRCTNLYASSRSLRRVASCCWDWIVDSWAIACRPVIVIATKHSSQTYITNMCRPMFKFQQSPCDDMISMLGE